MSFMWVLLTSAEPAVPFAFDAQPFLFASASFSLYPASLFVGPLSCVGAHLLHVAASAVVTHAYPSS
jgi:hypothetical protein